MQVFKDLGEVGVGATEGAQKCGEGDEGIAVGEVTVGGGFTVPVAMGAVAAEVGLHGAHALGDVAGSISGEGVNLSAVGCDLLAELPGEIFREGDGGALVFAEGFESEEERDFGGGDGAAGFVAEENRLAIFIEEAAEVGCLFADRMAEFADIGIIEMVEIASAEGEREKRDLAGDVGEEALQERVLIAADDGADDFQWAKSMEPRGEGGFVFGLGEQCAITGGTAERARGSLLEARFQFVELKGGGAGLRAGPEKVQAGGGGLGARGGNIDASVCPFDLCGSPEAGEGD